MSTGPSPELRPIALGCAIACVGLVCLLGGVLIGRLGPSMGALDDVAQLAQMIDDPDGYADDTERDCVEKGDPDACSSLGLHYAYGTYGRTQDYDKAHEYLSIACDGGDAGGCQDLGVLYMYGRGVDQDPARAMALFEVSCAAEVANGCHYLGDYHTGRDGVEADPEAARAWFQKACDAGSTSSCERAAE